MVADSPALARPRAKNQTCARTDGRIGEGQLQLVLGTLVRLSLTFWNKTAEPLGTGSDSG
jgi:hypothetical protein